MTIRAIPRHSSIRAAAEGRVVSNTEASYQHTLIKQKNLPITRPIREFGKAVADKTNRPVRDVVKKVSGTIKTVADRLTPKVNRQ
ncbi:MAG: hypothetical protein QOJ24_717 [Mycobacterium sp.]|nr:hypothetical protein [Mycobacterium sp.]